MTGGAEVGAAVVHQQSAEVKGEVVLVGIDGGVEAARCVLVLLDEELQLSSVAVLSVPKHGVAAHAEPASHAALQSQRGSCLGQQVFRLQHFDGGTCRT